MFEQGTLHAHFALGSVVADPGKGVLPSGGTQHEHALVSGEGVPARNKSVSTVLQAYVRGPAGLGLEKP